MSSESDQGTTIPAKGDEQFTTRTIGPNEAAPGMVIGSYRLLQQIGQGGMGQVWLAEQQIPVRRRVAMKLIKEGMDTREVVARFESERQALALMDHPAIAKVFDAGSTSLGRPYFVMEYVTGIPITDYCDQHKLNTRQRLELFRAVCDGVQHAHQKAILHRDLKPSNILVGEVDGKPAPRIIDFGVAKATAQPLSADAAYTWVGAILGTPGYMSPEQAGSAGANVDTRTDVYSLGVVLYQLLVGALPLDFSKTTMDEFARRLREEDAPRPSTKLRTLGDQTATIAQNRGTDTPTLTRQLRGDLDAITLKALEKDRARRYASPSELAADIGRYLRNEPVLARPASAGYRAGKYVRRHRLGVTVAAGVAVLLISAAVAQTIELQRIKRERDRADRIAQFMTDMFKVSDPSAARGNSITAREVLDKASKEMDSGLAKDPELQAQMMETMGEVYSDLGLYPKAQALLTRAFDIRRRVLGARNPATLTAMATLGWTISEQGRFGEAEKLMREALDLQRRVLGPEHRHTLASMANLANVIHYQGRNAEAEKMFLEGLEIQRRVLGPENKVTLASMTNLSGVLIEERRYAEAEKLLREALEIQRRVLGPDSPDALASMTNLANALNSEGHYAEAEKVLGEALEIQRRVLGPEHQATLISLINLANTLHGEGRNDEAEKMFRETLETSRRVLGPDNTSTAILAYNVANMSALRGDHDGALTLLRGAVDHGLPPDADLGIEQDPDFKSLLGDPRFAALVAHAKERAAAVKKTK